MKFMEKNLGLIKRITQIVLLVGIALFGLFFLFGGSDVAAQRLVSHQYQSRQHQALITHVNTKQVQIVNRFVQGDFCNLIFSKQTQADFQKLFVLLNKRQRNERQIASYYDGHYYADLVTQKRLNQTDKHLLQEKNQTVYQQQKNRLDTIQIWFDQTQDANKFLTKTRKTFQADPRQLNLAQVSQANAYYKLIKNRRWQHYWQPQMQKILTYFKNAQANKDKSQLAQENAELEELKNAPLTQAYRPAHVTIIDNVQAVDVADKILQDAGITANKVLYFSQNDQTLSLLRRSGGHYHTQGALIRVTANQVMSGSYRIRALISNPSETAGVITDPQQSNFGRYYEDATGMNAEINTISDYNLSQPIFWLKNNPTLQTSILFSNSQTLGFIYSGSSVLNNGICVAESDLIQLTNVVDSGTLLYIS